MDSNGLRKICYLYDAEAPIRTYLRHWRPKKDERSEPERIEDWGDHLKNAPAVFLITEKARKGECSITLDLLEDLGCVGQET